MTRTFFSALLAMLAMLCTACSPDTLMQQIVDQSKVDSARAILDRLNSSERTTLLAELDPSIQAEDPAAVLLALAAILPDQAPLSEKVVGYHALSQDGVEFVNVTFEREYPGQWLLANVATKTEAGRRTIVGLNVQPNAQSLRELNRFTLTDKSLSHYLILSAAIVAFLFTTYTLYRAARTPIPKRKWLWLLFVACGFGQVAIQWTSGAVAVSLLSVQLFSAGATAPLYGPWLISCSLPLGAIAFWWRRKRWLSSAITLQ
ncbi:MAG: hypothetical protein ACK4E7_09180 [Permianibacter sp.]